MCGKVDNYIIEKIISQLSNNQILIDTGWLISKDPSIAQLDNTKIAVCYSGIDWENTGCILERVEAHKLIKNNSKSQIHIGNSKGKYYFSYWVEFIRQNPTYFFDPAFTQTPVIEKLFLSYNRKSYPHREFLLKLIDNNDLTNLGIISRPDFPIMDLIYDPTQITCADSEFNNEFPNDIYSLGNPVEWNRFLINVIAETTKHTNVFLSEKTWKPIIGLRPFLILGDDSLYNHLQGFGFDTFDDLFGTWWKSPRWGDRAQSIVDILKKFDANPDSLNMLYQKLLPRLLNNRKRFEEYMIENHNKILNLGI